MAIQATILDRGLKPGDSRMAWAKVEFSDGSGFKTTEETFGEDLTPDNLARWIGGRIASLTKAIAAKTELDGIALNSTVEPLVPSQEEIARSAFMVAYQRATTARQLAALGIIADDDAQSFVDEAKALYKPAYLGLD